MGKLDCIVEIRKEAFDSGYKDAVLKVAKNMLLENFFVETVSRLTELPVSEITNLKMNLNREI